ncbi:EpsG family protein [Vibrio sp. 10N.222.55.F12]|uniref:EpsG family protein n=1 Tax=Vibrio sp. 10N.222.55.F12 TaxID=3229653 RepID=UPI003552FDD5
MLPYFLLISVILCSYGTSKYLRYTSKQGSIIFTAIAVLSLIMFAALRAPHVGTDSRTYLAIWNYSIVDEFELTLFSEPLFLVYNYITKTIVVLFDLDYWLFFFGISSIVCYLYINSIERLSVYKTQSLLLFILLGFYTYHFNGARQAITIAVFLFAYRYIVSGEAKKYLFIIFIGFLVHKSIIIALPFYYFFRVGLTLKNITLIVLGSLFMALSVQSVVDVAASYDSRYSGYADPNFGGGGLTSVLFFSALLVWLWLSMRMNRIVSKLYENALLAMLVSVCIGWLSLALSLNPSGILRLIAYFTQFSILTLPISVMAFPAGIQRTVVAMSVYTVLFSYFYLNTSSFSGLSPYRMSVELPL